MENGSKVLMSGLLVSLSIILYCGVILKQIVSPSEFSQASEYTATEHLQHGDVYLSQNKWNLAKDAYQKAIQQNPYSYDGYIGLGHIYSHQKQWEDAEKEFQRAIVLKPHETTGYKFLANAYLEQRKPNQAIQQLLKAANMNEKNDPKIPLMMGLSYLEKGEIDQASSWLNKALSMAPMDAQAQEGLCALYQGTEEWKKALPYCIEAVKLVSDEGVYHGMLSYAYCQNGQTQKAKEEYETAKALGYDESGLSAALLQCTAQ